MGMNDMVWYDARGLSNDHMEIMESVYNGEFKYILLLPSQMDMHYLPKRFTPIFYVDNINEIDNFEKGAMILSNNTDILNKSVQKELIACFYEKITDNRTMMSAREKAAEYPFAVIELVDKTNIPLELLIATFQSTNTNIMKIVDSVQEAEIAFSIMEAGVDGVVYKSRDINDISQMNLYMKKSKKGTIGMVKAVVESVTHIGMGSRVCIDTTSILTNQEGFIIGSTSEGGLLVSTETHYLPYMKLRPFRVNAGAVHSYVWGPDDTTNYLSEFEAGDPILCVDINGNTREVRVGRVKIEERPLLKITAIADDILINTILQDDWHVRIYGFDGLVRNVSDIKQGDEMLAYVCRGGRHVGIKIDETIIEK